MATVIYDNQKTAFALPPILCRILPYRVTDEIRGMGACVIEEIRLRSGRASSLTTPHGNVVLKNLLSRMELENILQAICDGSLYAHSETITQGYVTLEGGIRVGLCGRAAVEGGRVIGVYGTSGLNIRLPGPHRRVGAPICRMLWALEGTGGVLIYSAPGVGKTTLLRSVAAEMGGGSAPLRVVVVDSRGEIAPFLENPSLCVDVLSGYPKPVGIEIACRTMNAQLIVCDEIGDEQEAKAIVTAQNCGVPFVATAHASSVEGLLRRSAILSLHRARIFEHYVGIRRRAEGGDFLYTVTDWEDANVALQANGRGAACV